MEHIMEVIREYTPKVIRDIGCGSGRFFDACLQKSTHPFSYIWVDSSPSFIEIAREEYADTETSPPVFTCEDMLQFLQAQTPHTADAIVGIASVQHLFTRQERARFFLEAYRTLSYGGVLILVNRSFSDRFLRQYPIACFDAALRRCLSLWERWRNDVSIPRKDADYASNKQKFSRFYHIFTQRELISLAKQAGFHITEMCYIQKSWEKTQNRRAARNTFLVAKKMPILKY